MAIATTSSRIPRIFLHLSRLLSPFSLLFGLLFTAYNSQKVYTDEAALLSSFASPSPLPPLSDNNESLLARLRNLNIRAELYDDNGCTAISAVLRARQARSGDVLLLAVEVGLASDLSDADTSRAAEITLQLANILIRAPWLSKDVLLLLHAPCGCGGGVGDGGGGSSALPTLSACPNGALWRFLTDHHMLNGTESPSAPTAERRAYLRRGSPIRQLLTFSLRSSTASTTTTPRPSAPRPSALAVELTGASGRLPNLDTYASLWKVATKQLNVPLVLPSTGRLLPLALTECVRRSSTTASSSPNSHYSPIMDSLRGVLPLDAAYATMRFALDLAYGAPRGEHAAGLAFGIDSLSLTSAADLTDAQSSPALTACQRSVPPLSDRQIIGLLEGTLRSWSNLDEALHHSHYSYILSDPSTLVPLKLTGPLLHLPPLIALLIRAASHHSHSQQQPPSPPKTKNTPRLHHFHIPPLAAAVAAVALIHLTCAALLLLPPPISPYLHPSSSSPPLLPLPPFSLLSLLQLIWLTLSLTLTAATRAVHEDAIACACCLLAASAVFVGTCASIHTALIGSLVLSAITTYGLPPPPPTQTTSATAASSRTGRALLIAKELLMLMLVSPWAVLLVLTALVDGRAASTLTAAALAWQHAAVFGALPYAFAIGAVAPLGVVAASLRLRRIAAVLTRAKAHAD